MYELIGNFRTRTQRVIWLLEEIGCEYRLIDAAPASDLAKSYHEDGKVPILRCEGNIVIDSRAIMQFIADREGQFTSAAGSFARARQDEIMSIALDDIDAVLWTMARSTRLNGADELLENSVKTLVQEGFTRLEREITGEYFFGENFTIADIYCAHILAWAKSLGHHMPKPLLAYYRRCYARPAAQEMRAKFS